MITHAGRHSFSFATARIAPSVAFVACAIIPTILMVEPGVPLGLRVGSAAVALPLLFMAYRLARVALVVDDDGVAVRNVARTVRIPWDDVDAFISKRWLRGTPYEIGAVRRRGGEEVLALGLTPPFGDPRPLARVIDELEAVRREHASVRAGAVT
jgi:hypothetical protein